MKFEFYDDFSGHADYEHPDGWLIERHSPLSHGHAYVLDGSYALMLPGNKQIPVTPALSGFTLDIVCRGDIHFNAVSGIIIYFRYDLKNHQGYYLNSQWGDQRDGSGLKVRPRQEHLQNIFRLWEGMYSLRIVSDNDFSEREV